MLTLLQLVVNYFEKNSLEWKKRKKKAKKAVLKSLELLVLGLSMASGFLE